MASPLLRAQSIAELREQARRRLPRAVFDFFDGGAEDEGTLRDNARAFERQRLLPRVLRGVDTVDTSTELLGGASSLPLAVAPMGAIGLGWRGADLALARAAAAAGIPYMLSSASHDSLEDVARAAPGRLWFQPYMLRQRDFVHRWLERALAADFEGLVLTVDLPVGGKRERDARNHFALPFRFTPRNVLDFARHPRWSLDMLLRGQPVMGNMVGLNQGPATAAAAGSTVGRNMDASFDFEALQRIRDRWPRKLLAKGVMRADDARRLVAMGCEGIVVSNHGGRQLDGALAALEALPAVVAAVQGRTPVLLDGGVRRGQHLVQALAAGAQGVLVGRALLYGVAAAGEAGARHALGILQEEFARAMRLCGARTVGEITPDLLSAARSA